MSNEEKLSKALNEFRRRYPNVTSADLQTFVIGWTEAVKSYFVQDGNSHTKTGTNQYY